MDPGLLNWQNPDFLFFCRFVVIPWPFWGSGVVWKWSWAIGLRPVLIWAHIEPYGPISDPIPLFSSKECPGPAPGPGPATEVLQSGFTGFAWTYLFGFAFQRRQCFQAVWSIYIFCSWSQIFLPPPMEQRIKRANQTYSVCGCFLRKCAWGSEAAVFEASRSNMLGNRNMSYKVALIFGSF